LAGSNTCEETVNNIDEINRIIKPQLKHKHAIHTILITDLSVLNSINDMYVR